MDIEEQVRVIGAIMQAAGLKELFVPNALLEDVLQGGEVFTQEDFPRDGWIIRYRKRPTVIRAEVVGPKEISS